MASIIPSQRRCERKLHKIFELKQKDCNTAEELEIISQETYYANVMNDVYNVKLVEVFVPVVNVCESSVMKRCNYNEHVYRQIETGRKYVIEMPDINTVLNVTCTFAACRAADMYIDVAVVNGIRDYSAETCTISYNYEKFDTIYYTSFDRPDKCYIYSH